MADNQISNGERITHLKIPFPENEKGGSSPIELKRKGGFLSEKDLFSLGSAIRNNSLLPKGPMPGQESMRLAKKGGDSSFPIAGFRRFRPGIPLPPLLFAETHRGHREGSPRPFWASAPAFLPGQQGDGFKRPTKWEMIQKFFLKRPHYVFREEIK